tara:strand:- start:105 stop:356 length:252 start_codon:yes stop_codon:yes gene_type:complete
MLNQKRLKLAQQRMREGAINDYLVLTHDDHIHFFEEDRYQPWAIIPTEGSPVIMAFRGEEQEIAESSGEPRTRGLKSRITGAV